MAMPDWQWRRVFWEQYSQIGRSSVMVMVNFSS
jgi:hypothetical protein